MYFHYLPIQISIVLCAFVSLCWVPGCCNWLLSTLFPFLFFLSIGWYYGAGGFGLIGYTSLSLSLALPTFFNNNNNNNYELILFLPLPDYLQQWVHLVPSMQESQQDIMIRGLQDQDVPPWTVSLAQAATGVGCVFVVLLWPVALSHSE